ncbi:MAG: glycine--tRNA ligase subunit beta, partial [Candidatus Omnitrophica bacterium]|nr:glycine--tRNA ligase subunit beta [Candidatus Omnitrophota bacterium]
EKAERVHKLALMLAQDPFNLHCDLPVLDRAAYLAKADLSTRLVTEMTALQGTAGKFYALAAGEPEAVANAIEEHYSPRSAKDSFPQSPEGLIISIADRLDNLAALFAADAKVTSTSDPYGLRRDAYGVVGSLLNLNEPFSLRRGIDAAAEILPVELTAEKREEVYTFIVRRFENLLEERGYAKDAIGAVLSPNDVDPVPAVDILDYIQKNRESALFLDAAEVYNRCERIIRKSLEAEEMDGVVKENLFQHEQEKQLWRTIQNGLEQISQIDLASNRFEKGIILIADMKELVADFFDHVTVMDENPDFRQNRFALLNHIVSMLRRWGDLRYLEIS